MENLKIELEDVPKKFIIEKRFGKYRLSVGSAKPFDISFPLKLDLELAKISGMILDGCICKNLSHVSFCQGKDRKKVTEFGRILKRKFGVNPIFYHTEKYDTVTIGSKSLSSFLHSCLDLHKSDEDARIPAWIVKSDLKILKEYLRCAFAMEGSVSNPSKGGKEIKFHSCDKSFLVQLSGILFRKFGIKSYIQTYTVKGYGNKYYISISNRKNIIRFTEIGFALKTHQERLRKIVKSYNNRAWEITLIVISNINNQLYSVTDVHKKFPYLQRKSVIQRLNTLLEMGFLKEYDKDYKLTKSGLNKVDFLKGKVKVTKLRTNPKENENIILKYLSKKGACISQVAKILGVHEKTTRDAIRRLVKFGKVRLFSIDKFQRKIYKAGKGR